MAGSVSGGTEKREEKTVHRGMTIDMTIDMAIGATTDAATAGVIRVLAGASKTIDGIRRDLISMFVSTVNAPAIEIIL
jgi:hypothetical protein